LEKYFILPKKDYIADCPDPAVREAIRLKPPGKLGNITLNLWLLCVIDIYEEITGTRTATYKVNAMAGERRVTGNLMDYIMMLSHKLPDNYTARDLENRVWHLL